MVSYWYCPNCKIELDGCHVTYEEKCEYCGSDVLSVPETISQEELDELIKAKADGRLVVLPCKVGDTVYIAVKEWDARYCLKSSFVPCVREGTVAHICISHKGIIVCVTVKGEYSEYYDIGKTVFLTREAAEKALTKGAEHHEV